MTTESRHPIDEKGITRSDFELIPNQATTSDKSITTRAFRATIKAAYGRGELLVDDAGDEYVPVATIDEVIDLYDAERTQYNRDSKDRITRGLGDKAVGCLRWMSDRLEQDDEGVWQIVIDTQD